MHNATAITTGSANQRPNTPCIRLWIDVTFRGLEGSYYRSKHAIDTQRPQIVSKIIASWQKETARICSIPLQNSDYVL